MNWRIDFAQQAVTWLTQAPAKTRRKVARAIDRLQEDPSQLADLTRDVAPLEIVDGPVHMVILVDPSAGRATVLSLTVDPGLEELPRGEAQPGHALPAARIPDHSRSRLAGRLLDLAQEVRFAIRALSHRPAFTAIVLVTLALGLTATAAVFSVVDAVLLRPLPYPEAEQLAMVWESSPDRPYGTVAPANWRDWRDLSENFEDIAAYNGWSPTLTEGEGDPEEVPGALVSTNFLDVLRVPVVHGRGFLADDATPGQEDVVVLGHALWQRRFGGDLGLIGTTLQISGVAHEVLGILPPGFRLPDDDWTDPPQVLAPLSWEDPPRDSRYLHPVGRLQAGVTTATAQAEMDTMARDLEAAHPVANRERGILVMPLRDHLVGDARQGLLLLFGAVLLLLVIVVTNIGNLVLARGETQGHELALRAALGARRGTLLRLVVIEALLLSLGGAVLGFLLLTPGLGALRLLQARFFAATPAVEIDGRSIAFSLALAVVVGLVIGLIGATRVLRQDGPASLLGSLTAGSGRHSSSLRGGFVIAQVALSVVLLVAAGLLATSFARQTSVPVGFEPEGVLTFDVGAPRDRYPDAESVRGFYARLVAELGAAPGVAAVGLTSDLPFTDSNMSNMILSDGLPTPEPGAEPAAEFRNVSPGYVAAAGLQLVRGRDLSRDDTPDSPPVALVNQSMASRFWPNGEALGATFRLDQADPEAPPHTVVGIVADVLDDGYGAAPEPFYYVNSEQSTWRWYTVLVRVNGDPVGWVADLRAALLRVDPLVPMANPTPMSQILAGTADRSRAGLWLLGIFTTAALVLATLGVYGILAYAVTRRSREIGIRSALGAGSREITRMILRDSMRRVGAGLIAGMLLAALAAQGLKPLLYRTAPAEATVYVLAAVCVALVCLLVSLVPARRAAGLNPVVALRRE